MADAPLAQPNAWLVELARVKPARWPVGRSIRAAIAVSVPLGIAFLAGAMPIGMWISLAALVLAAGERAGSYQSIVRNAAIAAPIGALGFFAGHLGALPWLAALPLIALLAFGAGLISSLGAAVSAGAMQALLIASIALGVPTIAPFWQPAALFLVGALVFCALVGVEALILRGRPQREATGALLAALTGLARSRAAWATAGHRDAASLGPLEEARGHVTDKLAALYSIMLDTRFRHTGRDPASDALAATVQRCDAAFAALMAEGDAASLDAAAGRLAQVTDAVAQGSALPPPAAPIASPALADAIAALAAALFPDTAAHTQTTAAAPGPATSGTAKLLLLLARKRPGAVVVRSALALSLCLFLAYAYRLVVNENHWFWVPLTVCIIMKPDFGSIFARAVLRSVGTLGGVFIGAAALALLSKGLDLVVLIAVLAAILPWAILRSYALQAVALTPLVLIFVDIIAPGMDNVDYAIQRLVDTVVGAGIVLVFGYYLWPRTHRGELAANLRDAMGSVSAYLLAASRASAGGDGVATAVDVAGARRNAYGTLSDLRTRLQMAAAEPPPAGREAVAWFPLVAAAERICDQITASAASLGGDRPLEARQALQSLARDIAAIPDPAALERSSSVAEPVAGEEAFVQAVRGELAHMARLLEPARP